MFKNAQIYRLTAPISSASLESALANRSHGEIGASEMMRQGWVMPRGDKYVHSAHGYHIIALATDKRVLPSSVVNLAVKSRVAEIEKAQGFAPGKRATKEIKERVIDELTPRAFVKRDVTRALIAGQWLIVDASAPAKADDMIKHLLKAVERFPVESLRVQRSTIGAMTAWLQDDAGPVGFTIDQDATMRATGESKAQVTYKRHTLEPDAMRQHIAAGKQCVKLAMTWDSKISFVLDQALAIKRIALLDVLSKDSAAPSSQEEKFDGELVLFAGEFTKLLNDLAESLGGIAQDQIAA